MSPAQHLPAAAATLPPSLTHSCLSPLVCRRLATLQQTLQPTVQGARLLVFAADHGITKAVPAVSAYPRSVTPAMFAAIARGQAACNVLAAANSCSVILTDVGIASDVSSITAEAVQAPSTTLLHKKVRHACH